MRELGVAAHNGTILGPPPRSREDIKNEEKDPHRVRRAFYETQLGRPVSDDEIVNYP